MHPQHEQVSQRLKGEAMGQQLGTQYRGSPLTPFDD